MARLPSCVRRADLLLARCLGRLGTAVATAPVTFLLVPLLVSALLASGFQRFSCLADTQQLFVPVQARGLRDLAAVQALFPDTYTSYVCGATAGLPNAVDLNLVARDGGSALANDLWREAAQLAGAVRQVRAEAGGRRLGWQDICAKFEGRCVDDSFLELAQGWQEARLANLSYPVHLEEQASGPPRWHPLAAHIGGAKVEGRRLVEAQALKLTFVLGDEEDMAAHRQLWVAGVEQLQAAVTLRTAELSCYWTGVIEREHGRPAPHPYRGDLHGVQLHEAQIG
jgi:hypothetical protein